MNCPVCRSVSLQSITLDPALQGHECPQCHGIFLRSDNYWKWREQLAEELPEQTDPEPQLLPVEPPKAKQCPQCQHILLPYRVALDLTFTVDHCGSCNGVWFDQGEWRALLRRNLHDNLHQIFAAPWQRRLREAQHQAAMEAIYIAKFGAEDYAEAKRIKAWLNAHPEAIALRAYLNALDPYQP